MQTPCPSQGRRRRYIRCENFSIPDAGVALSNTWSIGRVTARRKGPGSTQRIFWIPVWWRNSTETTRKDRPPDHVEDLGVDHLLASGAARRGGALSRRALLRLPLLVIDGNHHPSISLTTSPSSPVPGTHYLSHLSPITWAI